MSRKDSGALARLKASLSYPRFPPSSLPPLLLATTSRAFEVSSRLKGDLREKRASVFPPQADASGLAPALDAVHDPLAPTPNRLAVDPTAAMTTMFVYPLLLTALF